MAHGAGADAGYLLVAGQGLTAPFVIPAPKDFNTARQSRLWDSPQFPAGTKKGWKHFVSTIGVYEDGKFHVLGSVTWGFDVVGGKVKMMKPRASTHAEQRGSLHLIRRDHPDFRFHKEWIEEGE